MLNLLVITRKKGESILIGDDIEISISKIEDGSVKLAIKAPKEMTILRKELYEEVGEISHRISEGGLWLDDYYLFHETLRDYRNKQSKEQQEELERVLRNERFRGRQRVLRDLRIVFKEFDLRTR